MSIIHRVSPAGTGRLQDKLKEHLGVSRLVLGLVDGSQITGVIAELGEDYLQIIEDGGRERVILLSGLLWLRLP